MSEEIKIYLESKNYSKDNIILFFAGVVGWSGYLYTNLIIYDKGKDNILSNENGVQFITNISEEDLDKIKLLINENNWLVDENTIKNVEKEYCDKYYSKMDEEYSNDHYYHRIENKEVSFNIPDTNKAFDVKFINELVDMYINIYEILKKYNVKYQMPRGKYPDGTDVPEED